MCYSYPMRLVFDLDGVLLDSESDLSWLHRALSQTLRSIGLPDTEENRSRLYPTDLAEFEGIAEQVGIEPEELWRERDQHYTRTKLAAMERGELAPFSDIESLSSLGSDHELHVISNSPQAVVDSFVTIADLEQAIEITIGRGTTLDALDRLKPDPHPYERLVEKIGREGQFVYVGDTETDRQFAANTGMYFIHLTRNAEGVGGLDELHKHLPGNGGTGDFEAL